MQDVQHLASRITHVRKTFQFFCSQVAGKVREFVEQLAHRTLAFARPQSPPSLARAGRPAVQVFRPAENLSGMRAYPGELPEESFRMHEKVKSVSPRSRLAQGPRAESPRDTYADYYSGGGPGRAAENKSPGVYLTRAVGLSSCRNHEDHSTLHRHTCEKSRGWLRSVKSEERLKGGMGDTKFDYRRYLPTHDYY